MFCILKIKMEMPDAISNAMNFKINHIQFWAVGFVLTAQ